jgi:sugar lactone lactonase YvrE
MTTSDGATSLIAHLVFPEGARWYDGRFWFVDMFGHKVLTLTPSGDVTLVREMDDRPSGLGFLADGTPIVVTMEHRKIIRLDETGSVHADLEHIPASHLNDMVVDGQGRAYVDVLQERKTFGSGGDVGDSLVLVEPDGVSRIVARGDLIRPNGLALSSDSRTLYVAESIGRRITTFTVGADGALHDRQPFAETAPRSPDGICLDEEGCIWYSSPRTAEFVRVRPGGQVTDVIGSGDRWAIACVLGGVARRVLFMLSARVPENPTMENLHTSQGWAELTTVPVAGAGWP